MPSIFLNISIIKNLLLFVLMIPTANQAFSIDSAINQSPNICSKDFFSILNNPVEDCISTKSYHDLKIKIYFPCTWKDVETIAGGNVLGAYASDIKGSSSVIMILRGEENDNLISDEMIEKMRAQEFSKIQAEAMGDKFISSRKFQVGNVKCKEIICSKKTKSGGFMYYIGNFFYFTDKIVTMMYSASSTTEAKALLLLSNYKAIFRNLVLKTEITHI